MSLQQIPIEKRVEALQKIQSLSALSNTAIHQLAELLSERKVRNQEVICRKGDEGNFMFIILEGEVRVHDGNHVLARLGAGEVVGEFSLIDNEKRSATVTSEQNGILLQLDRDDFVVFMQAHPELLLGLLHMQVKRVRDMNELEDKLSKSYLRIIKQKEEIEKQHIAILEQKKQADEQNKELMELHAYKKGMVSTLIHGLKNPLTSALMMTDMLLNQNELTDDSRSYAQLVKQSLLRMDDVFNQVILTNQRDEPM